MTIHSAPVQAIIDVLTAANEPLTTPQIAAKLPAPANAKNTSMNLQRMQKRKLVRRDALGTKWVLEGWEPPTGTALAGMRSWRYDSRTPYVPAPSTHYREGSEDAVRLESRGTRC